MTSYKPKKMRKNAATAPMHHKQKTIAAHLSEKLATELKLKTLTVRKNDIVRIVRGEFRGREGKVLRTDVGAHNIFIEKIVRKKSNGEEFEVAVDPSNTILVDLDRTDKKRLKRGKKAVKA